MATFYIFRHGETFATKVNGWYGRRVFSAPILEEGKPAIRKMAQYLQDKPTDFNARSPYLRCKQTAEIVTEVTGKTFVSDKRLGEFFLEPFGHFHRRVKSFLKEIESKGYEHVAICSHGAVLALLIKHLQDPQAEKHIFYAPNKVILKYPPPGVLVVVEGRKVTELNFN